MEKRLLLAAALSLAVLAAWEFLVPKPPKPAPRPAPPLEATAPAPRGTAANPPASPAASPAEVSRSLPAPVAGKAEEKTVIANPVVRATFTSKGAVISSLVLLHHTDDKKQPLELVRQSPGSGKPLAIEFPGNPDLTRRVGDALYADERPSEKAVRFSYADDAVSVTKEARFENGYLFDVTVSVVGPRYTLVAAEGLRNPTEEELASRYVSPATAVVSSASGMVRERPDKLEKP